MQDLIYVYHLLKKGKHKWGVAIIKWKVWRWTKTNNAPPNESPCHVPNSNKMTMKAPCREV
jgi:hypothetical protein